MKLNIFGVNFDNYSDEEAIAIILDCTTKKLSPEYVVTSNAHHLIQIQKNPEFSAIYHNAFLSIPDSNLLLWLAKLQKITLSCISGKSLLAGICAEAANQKLKVFFFGDSSGAAKLAATKLKQKHPHLQIDTYCPSVNFERDRIELAKINQKIANAAPDILFVGLSSPQQETWIANNYKKLKLPISIGIGNSFELFSEVTKVTPIWIQQMGLEWLHHLLTKTRHLVDKNTLANTIFFWLLLKQRF